MGTDISNHAFYEHVRPGAQPELPEVTLHIGINPGLFSNHTEKGGLRIVCKKF